MKVNDSGMPPVEYWETLFDLEKIVSWIDINQITQPVVEIGCGYGTFTIPIAKKIKGVKLYTYDIEESMIHFSKSRAVDNQLDNIVFQQADILEEGIPQDTDCCDAVLLFNILHFKERMELLREARRVLRENGTIYVIHWRSDIPTPRGPALDIRPEAEDIISDAKRIGLKVDGGATLFEPYHWGIKLKK